MTVTIEWRGRDVHRPTPICDEGLAEVSAEQQSIEGDAGRRKQLLWALERKLADDSARPIIFYTRAATCWQPYVKGLTIMVNSLYNGNRREDMWLDR